MPTARRPVSKKDEAGVVAKTKRSMSWALFGEEYRLGFPQIEKDHILVSFTTILKSTFRMVCQDQNKERKKENKQKTQTKPMD